MIELALLSAVILVATIPLGMWHQNHLRRQMCRPTWKRHDWQAWWGLDDDRRECARCGAVW